MMMESLLSIKSISKSFFGTEILKDVSLEIQKGEIHVLLGENGSGKTTLIKILAGVYKQERGSILFKGQQINLKNPSQATAMGIGIVFQDLDLFPEMTIFENIFLHEVKLHQINKEELEKLFPEHLRPFFEMFRKKMDKKVKQIGVPEKKMVQILKILKEDPDLLILDEPTAYLTEYEENLLFSIIKQLKVKGKTVLFISHRLSELWRIGDRFSILKDGRLECSDECMRYSEDEIVKRMLGKERKDYYPKLPIKAGSEVFRVENLSGRYINNISFGVREGEIVGVAGIIGSGRSTLASIIMGVEKKTSGQIYMNGAKVRIDTPKDAFNLNIGYLPENRDRDGLVLCRDVNFNVMLGPQQQQLIKPKIEEYKANYYVNKLGIKGIAGRDKIEFMSSGNKQKILFARCIREWCKFVILDEPTVGVDSGGKVEIYNLINVLIQDGVGVLLISSNFSELVGMCDRILVMRKGSMVMEMNRNETTQNRVYSFACGMMIKPQKPNDT